jgi:glucokinase
MVGYAGEIGHVQVPAAATLRCLCGQVGCLETVASAAGVVRSYAEGSGDASAGTGARRVADLARAGAPAAQGAFALAARALTEALMLTLTLLGPELVIIGGGLAGAADLLVPAIQSGLAERVTFQRVPRVVPARLGADAGVIGAGLLGWEHARAAQALT